MDDIKHFTIPRDVFELVRPLLQALGRDNIRLVGGYVRDAVLYDLGLSKSNKEDICKKFDLDFAVRQRPEEVMEVLTINGIKVIPTGLKHGTVSAIMKNGSVVEITTLRRDETCDGRHAEVNFNSSWKEDAYRRDFTINALYFSFEEENGEGIIHDYLGGLRDLQKKRLRFIGKAADRINEDYLRIIRYFRFAALLGPTSMYEEEIECIKKLSEKLLWISGERIKEEMFRLTCMPFASEILISMYSNNILNIVQLILKSLRVHALLQAQFDSACPLLNIAALFILSDSNMQEVEMLCTRWKLSKRESKALYSLTINRALILEANTTSALLMNDAEYYLYKLGHEDYIAHLHLVKILYPEMSERVLDVIGIVQSMDSPRLHISGCDMIDMGLKDRDIGTALRYGKEIWINSRFKIKRDALLKEIAQYIGKGGNFL